MKKFSFFLILLTALTMACLTNSMDLDVVQEEDQNKEQDFNWLRAFFKEGIKIKGSFFDLPTEMGSHIAEFLFKKTAVYYWLANQKVPFVALERTRRYYDYGNPDEISDKYIVFNRDKTRFVTIAQDFACMALYNAATCEKIGDFQEYEHLWEGVEHRSLIDFAVFNADGTSLITVSRLDAGPVIWDVETRRIRQNLSEHPDGHDSPIKFAATDEIGSRLVTWGEDSTIVKIWDLQSFRVLSETSGIWTEPGFNQDKSLCVLVQRPPDERELRIISIVDLNSLKLKSMFNSTNGHVWSARFNREGSELVTTYFDSLAIWDVESGTVKKTFQGNFRYALFDTSGRGMLAIRLAQSQRFSHAEVPYFDFFQDGVRVWSVESFVDCVSEDYADRIRFIDAHAA